MSQRRKKLIEVALPLREINEQSAREKSIRHGHPSTLHLWWARRPLAACRAVLFAQLVDDPSSDPAYRRPDGSIDEERAGIKRAELFNLIEELVRWENSNNPRVINKARAEIARCVASRKIELGELKKETIIYGREEGKEHPDGPLPNDGRYTAWQIECRLAPAEAVNHFLGEYAPLVLDPFAGGGSIPLEAQRLGLRAHASDLNPVPVLINKALIGIPPKFAGLPPVNPGERSEGRGVRSETGGKGQNELFERQWTGAEGLAEDVRYYGKWMRDEAEKRIGHLYPKVTAWRDSRSARFFGDAEVDEWRRSEERGVRNEDGESIARECGHPSLSSLLSSLSSHKLTVIAWLWARTVASPDPAVGGKQVPLVRSFWLSKKKGKEAYVRPVVDRKKGTYEFKVRVGKPTDGFDPGKGTVVRTGAVCLISGSPIPFDYVRDEGKAGRMYQQLMAIVCEGSQGRVYLSPTSYQENIADCGLPDDYPTSEIPEKALGFRIQLYGMNHHYKLFTPRQLTALTTFSDLVKEARQKVLEDALKRSEELGVRSENDALSGDDSVAESDGDDKGDLSSGSVAAERGDIRNAVADHPGSSVGSGEYSRGVDAGDGSRQGEFPRDSAGIAGRDGNAADALRGSGVVSTGTDPQTALADGRSQPHAHHHASQTTPGKEVRNEERETSGPLTPHSSSLTPQQYADAVATYLAIGIDRLAMTGNNLVRWNPVGPKAQHCFGRQALPMLWDFSEVNFFASSTGSIKAAIECLFDPLRYLGNGNLAKVYQEDATSPSAYSGEIISTDPPYYDNIGYADLSDFFYVWLRRSLREVYPDLLSTMLTPKAEELIASPYRHGGDKKKAAEFFETGLGKAIRRWREQGHHDYPSTIFYAFKQAETDTSGTASTGWETFLTGVIDAGFTITATWPLRTEMKTRQVAMGTNALASSVVLACVPRAEDAPLATRREFVTALKKELGEALRLLQSGNIAPVDLAQAAIGPGMAIFSRYAKVVESDGKPMTVRTALTLINQVLDQVLSEQEGEFDSDTRWAVAWFEQFGMEEGPFGVAETLSKAKNTSVQGLVEAGVVASQGGKVKLLGRDELPDDWPACRARTRGAGRDPATDARLTEWEAVQHLIRALDRQGECGAADLLRKLGSDYGERARDLAYRLYAVCERKGWSGEALAYNSLVIAWPEIGRLARQIPQKAPVQMSFLGHGD